MGLQCLTLASMVALQYFFFFLFLSSSQAAPQMERMGQPIADAYETVQSAVGSAMNVVFQLSSWFTDYETAPYTIITNIGDDGLEERLYPTRRWVCTKKISRADESDPKSGMFWSLFKYIQGANSAEIKIDMTTPVSTYVKEEGERKIFTRRVGGWMNPEKWEREANELKEVLKEKGLQFSEKSLYQVGYYAPSKVWNRRNEVWIYSLQ